MKTLMTKKTFSRLAIGTALGLALLAASDTASRAAAPPVTAKVAAPSVVTLPAWAASLPDDANITDVTRDAIQHEARSFAETANESQHHELFARLSHDPKCGRAHAAALAGALSAGIESPVITKALSSMATECNEVIVESVGFVPNPDAQIATALLANAESSNDDVVRRSAWLAYGSIGETARRSGKHELANAIDVTLSDKLDASSGAERVLFVRAAGNAGCLACKDTLDLAAKSKDDNLRRAAIAAHRYIESTGSVSVMCDALEYDRDHVARDMAAWSLEWGTSDAALRAGCLERAAMKDHSKGVRMQAVRALGILSGDLNEAHEALGRLAARGGEVGALASRTLEVHEGADDEGPTKLAQE